MSIADQMYYYRLNIIEEVNEKLKNNEELSDADKKGMEDYNIVIQDGVAVYKEDLNDATRTT